MNKRTTDRPRGLPPLMLVKHERKAEPSQTFVGRLQESLAEMAQPRRPEATPHRSIEALESVATAAPRSILPAFLNRWSLKMSNDITRLQKPTPPPRNPPTNGPPRELHPAAMEAAATYSRAIEEANTLRQERDRMQIDLLAEREIRRHLEQRLIEIEKERDALSRFSVEFLTHMEIIDRAISTAKEKAMRFARDVPRKTVADLEQGLKAAVAEVAADATDQPANPDRMP